jgi:hypothetical protein
MDSILDDKLKIMRDILKEISRISSLITDITSDENEDLISKLESLHKQLKANFVNYSDVNESSQETKKLVKEIKELFVINSSDNMLFQNQLSESLSYLKDEMQYYIPVKKAVGKYKVHSR